VTLLMRRIYLGALLEEIFAYNVRSCSIQFTKEEESASSMLFVSFLVIL